VKVNLLHYGVADTFASVYETSRSHATRLVSCVPTVGISRTDIGRQALSAGVVKQAEFAQAAQRSNRTRNGARARKVDTKVCMDVVSRVAQPHAAEDPP
jgi:hypothetical protein